MVAGRDVNVWVLFNVNNTSSKCGKKNHTYSERATLLNVRNISLFYDVKSNETVYRDYLELTSNIEGSLKMTGKA